jgi:uncharacterized protein
MIDRRIEDGAWDRLPQITTLNELEALGQPEPRNRDKVMTELGEVHQEWIAGCPLLFLATASDQGRCDVSPKGDPPGFVQILDRHTIAIPERAGNLRMDGYRNIITNPHVGTIFVIPGRPDTLRVNGRARLVTDGPFFDRMVVHRHRPPVAVLVHVEEVFFHCPRAFVRAQTWKPSSWRPDGVRRYAEIAHALWRSDQSLAEVEKRYEVEDPAAGLYPDTPSLLP